VVNIGEQPVDCILSKTQSQIYTLLNINGSPLPNSSGIANEAVKLAVKRLETHLKNLLAAKLWNLTNNQGSSRLGIKASLETIEPSKQTILQLHTKRYLGITPSLSNTQSSSTTSSINNLTLKVGTKIQYRLENYSDYPLYFLIVGINPNGNPFTIYSPNSLEGSLGIVLPSQTIIFPEPSEGFDWNISSPEGITQTQIIFSKAPFERTLATLETMKQFNGGVEKSIPMNEPVKVARAILEDLHNASSVSSELGGINKDVYALNVNVWATFNFVYFISSGT
jgi:hypothetical protein